MSPTNGCALSHSRPSRKLEVFKGSKYFGSGSTRLDAVKQQSREMGRDSEV